MVPAVTDASAGSIETTTALVVTSIAHGGDGIARADGPDGSPDGPTWFVRGALPGERVEAVAEHRAKRFVRGRAVKIVAASPARVSPPCPIAERCGGCSWQHVAVAEQGELKRRIVGVPR